MSDRKSGDFPESMLRSLEEAGVTGAELVSAEPESPAFGDTSVTFRLGRLLLRFIRDRGEEYLDLGSADVPDALFQLDDVEVAMGWRSVDEILEKNAPEPIELVLGRVARRLQELQTAFAFDRAAGTTALVRRAEIRRGEALAARLRGGQAGPLL